MNKPIPTEIPGVSIIRLPNIVSTDNWYKIKADKRWEERLREAKKIMDGKLALRDKQKREP